MGDYPLPYMAVTFAACYLPASPAHYYLAPTPPHPHHCVTAEQLPPRLATRACPQRGVRRAGADMVEDAWMLRQRRCLPRLPRCQICHTCRLPPASQRAAALTIPPGVVLLFVVRAAQRANVLPYRIPPHAVRRQ